MKKFTAFLLFCVLMLSFISCTESENKTADIGTQTESPAEDTENVTNVYAEAPGTRGEDEAEDSFDGITYDHNTEEIPETGNAIININDKDVSDTCYAYINKDAKNSEFAITSVMKEIGASVIWEGESTVTIKKDSLSLVFDISVPDFGLPKNPDSSHYVRKVIDGEIVIDRESANPFIRAVGYSVKINYELGIINIIPLS